MICSENLITKKLINSIFNDIINSKSISDIEKILENNNIETKYWIKTYDYPKIKFDISNSEIEKLEKESIIIDNIINHNKIKDVDNTVAKLLYAMAWKNGDLKKIRHIIQGIKDVEESSSKKNDGLVFYQFGKYLAKKESEPIIDQHVLRAFKVYLTDADKEGDICEARNLATVGKKEIELIKDYKNWLISDELSDDLKRETDYAYHIDKILFAVGKKIKSNKNEKKK